jgi:multidrug resistance protein, MATE family
VVAQLGVILLGVSDNIIVGRLLGAEALGAAGLANSTAFLIVSLATGGLNALAPIVSKSLAESGQKHILSLFRSSLITAFSYSLFLFVAGLLVYYIFEYLGQSPDLVSAVKPYFLVNLFTNFLTVAFIMLKQFTDAYQKPKISMYITFMGLTTNILLNLVLIKGYLGFPEMGLMGSAWATFYTRLIMLVILLIYFYYSSIFNFLFSLKNWKLNKTEIGFLYRKVVPAGMQYFFEFAAFTLAVFMMGALGETQLAAHQIAINIASTTYMMAAGIAAAGSIKVGSAWGEKNASKLMDYSKAVYIIVISFMSITMLLMLVLNKPLLEVYINDPLVVKKAIPLLIIAAFFQLSDGLQVVGLGLLRGLQDVKLPTQITFVAYWILALPLSYFLGFKLGLEERGIWWGLLVGLSISAMFLYFRFRYLTETKRLNKRMLESY